MQSLLRAKSHFSFGFGTASVPALVERAAQLGLPVLALVDEENLCGQIAFHHLCRARGVLPVTGVELDRRCVLLARDRAGWSALCRIVSARRAFGETDLDDVLRRFAGPLEVLPFDPSLEVTTLDAADERLHRLLALRAGRPARVHSLAEACRDVSPPADAARFQLDLTRHPRVLPQAVAPLERLRSAAAGRGAAYAERLEAELAVFSQMELLPYLGLVAEVCEWARGRDIELAVRGSSAGSLAVHLLGASPIDPLVHGLLFERFLHPGRAELPDVDLDVDSERRADLIDFVHRRFGRDRVAMVGTHVTFQPASAAHAVTDPELARRLVGTPRQLAMHPGGVVVADRPLSEIVPLERTVRGGIITQLDLRSVGEVGLVKLDLLGNRCLTQLHRAIALAGGPPRAQIPEDDPKTLAALDRADTLGCFQVETPPVRSLLVRLPIKSLDDCTAALAMVRPGPAAGEAKEAYVRRARGEGPPTPVHPLLEDLLRSTHGLLAYEEDLVRAVSRVGRMSLGEADAVRAAVVRGATITLGASEEQRAVAREVERFARYTFSKAHAAAYARLAFETVFMMQHHPLELGCALLDWYGGHYPLRTIAWELQRKGVRLLGPSVLRSQEDCTVERTDSAPPALRLGLGRIRRLSTRARRALISQRPQRALSEVASRVSVRELEALVLCGACDGLQPLCDAPFPVPHAQALAEAGSKLNLELFGRWPALGRVHLELTHLELSVSGHPMELLRGEAQREGCLTTRDVREWARGRVRVAGTLAASRPVETQGGNTMQFLTLEDEEGLLELVMFPGVRAALALRLVTPGPYLITGEVKRDHGDVCLEVRWLIPFFERERVSAA